MNTKEISKEARKLLAETIEHENDIDYWYNRFNNISRIEDAILRGVLEELQDARLIDVRYADDFPYYIRVLGDGYLYEKRLKESEQYFKPELYIRKDIGKRKYDVFLSHANVDKLAYVEDLYKELVKLGINIFYDSKKIEWGDNWKNLIEEGMEQSEFAIIVISKNFFGRTWTEKELNTFMRRQNESGQKLILPLLYEISIDELAKVYPFLADIQAISTAEKSKEEIAILLAKQLIRRYK